MKVCKFEECDNRHYGKGYCMAHWQQQRRGQPLTRLYGGRWNGYKICRGCKQDKPETEFYKRQDGKPRPRCKECMLAAAKERVQK